jgi:hypothetical protein
MDNITPDSNSSLDPWIKEQIKALKLASSDTQEAQTFGDEDADAEGPDTDCFNAQGDTPDEGHPDEAQPEAFATPALETQTAPETAGNDGKTEDKLVITDDDTPVNLDPDGLDLPDDDGDGNLDDDEDVPNDDTDRDEFYNELADED